MPFVDPEKRRRYLREYHAEFRLGLRRTETPAAVVARMDERRLEREEYLRAWATENRERRTAARRMQRREAKRRSLEGAVRKLG